MLKLTKIAAAAAVLAAAGLVQTASATVVLNETFTYPDGALVGQGNWMQTGTSTVNPLTVTGGQVPITTTGQDAWSAFSAAVPNNAGDTMYTAVDINLSAAQATGDYFLHVSDPAGTTSNFYQRLFARSSNSGYVLGLVDTSGTGSTTTFGTGELNFNTTYRLVIGWNFVSGTNNDTFNLYVDPTNPSEPGNPTYLTHAWTSALAEPAQLAAANLRQGTASNAPTLNFVDNLVVATQFSDVVIPEPASLAVVAGTALLALSRRRRSA